VDACFVHTFFMIIYLHVLVMNMVKAKNIQIHYVKFKNLYSQNLQAKKAFFRLPAKNSLLHKQIYKIPDIEMDYYCKTFMIQFFGTIFLLFITVLTSVYVFPGYDEVKKKTLNGDVLTSMHKYMYLISAQVVLYVLTAGCELISFTIYHEQHIITQDLESLVNAFRSTIVNGNNDDQSKALINALVVEYFYK